MDEIKLVRRCKLGDHSAFEGLYQLHARQALKTAYLITRSRPEAEDAVQLTRTARRMNFVPLDPDKHDTSDPHAPKPEELAEVNEALRQLRAAIASLSDTHRVPIVLRYYTGLVEMEIAQVLGIPVGTVKSRLHHARRTLQQARS